MADPNISEIVTTTIKHYSGVIADNVSDNNALVNRMMKRGNVKAWPGGTSILQELEYAENTTYLRYSGYQLLNIDPSTVLSAAEFAPKQIAVAVTISGLEELQNSGRERIHDLIKARVKNAGTTFKNNFSADIYSAGSLSNQIGGLQLIVADDPTTDTVGGIARPTWTFWQNQLYDFSAESVTAGALSTNIQNAMNTLWMRCKRGSDQTNLIVADDVYYGLYWNSLLEIQRIGSAAKASSGFSEILYKNDIPVILDGGQGGDCPASHMYFLNTDYLFLRPHSKFASGPQPLDPDRYATNQDAVVKLIGWAGQMTVSNCALQGVMHG